MWSHAHITYGTVMQVGAHDAVTMQSERETPSKQHRYQWVWISPGDTEK